MAFFECTSGGKTISLHISATSYHVENYGHYIYFTVSKDGKTIFTSPIAHAWSVDSTININCE